jgi:DNA-binding HxlR family transcriptional regulator
MGLKMRKSVAPPPPAGCPMQECMKLLGGAWTPEIIWHLSGGSRRFGELQKDIARISPKILTARLRRLKQKGVIERAAIATSPPSVEYSLSSLGRELIPVIDAIVKVGTRLTERVDAAAYAASLADSTRHEFPLHKGQQIAAMSQRAHARRPDE